MDRAIIICLSSVVVIAIAGVTALAAMKIIDGSAATNLCGVAVGGVFGFLTPSRKIVP
jgi:hypothetical protein